MNGQKAKEFRRVAKHLASQNGMDWKKVYRKMKKTWKK